MLCYLMVLFVVKKVSVVYYFVKYNVLNFVRGNFLFYDKRYRFIGVVLVMLIILGCVG